MSEEEIVEEKIDGKDFVKNIKENSRNVKFKNAIQT